VRWLRSIVVSAAVLGCAPTVADGAQPSGYRLQPGVGIGPISIRETKSQVERATGQATPGCTSCFRTYNSSRGKLLVRYDKRKVTGIGSYSGQITLGGIPIRSGPKRLHRQLMGWKRFRCQGLVYEYFGRHARQYDTTITFHSDKRVDIEISASGLGGCGGQ
jgi:hypothetical protein